MGDEEARVEIFGVAEEGEDVEEELCGAEREFSLVSKMYGKHAQLQLFNRTSTGNANAGSVGISSLSTSASEATFDASRFATTSLDLILLAGEPPLFRDSELAVRRDLIAFSETAARVVWRGIFI